MKHFNREIPGLTKAHKASLKKQGLDDPRRLSRLSARDVHEVTDVPLGVCVDLVDAAQAAAGLTRPGDLSDRELIEALARDPKPELVEAAERARLVLVPDADGLLDPDGPSADATAHAREHGIPPHWHGRPVVRPSTLVTPVRYSPRTLEPLQAGVDPSTGTHWPTVALADLEVITWAEQLAPPGVRVTIGRHHDEQLLAASTADEPPKWWVVLAAQITDDDRDRARELLTNGRRGGRPRRVAADRPPVEIDVDCNPEKALYDLLLGLFDSAELSRFLRQNGMTRVLNAIPGEGCSTARRAFEAVSAMRRTGFIGKRLFTLLLTERPGHASAVLEVARRWGVTL